MRLRICTWNVNSVRLRAEQAARFVAEQAPDVLCMQEIKCREGEFPREAFVEMGLPLGASIVHEVRIADGTAIKIATPRSPGIMPFAAGTAVHVLSAVPATIFPRT